VSAFVDQQKGVSTNIVDAVARDFDLGDHHATAAAMPSAGQDKFDLMDAVKTISNLAERLKDQSDVAKEGKL
jgi:hypothetical protein